MDLPLDTKETYYDSDMAQWKVIVNSIWNSISYRRM